MQSSDFSWMSISSCSAPISSFSADLRELIFRYYRSFPGTGLEFWWTTIHDHSRSCHSSLCIPQWVIKEPLTPFWYSGSWLTEIVLSNEWWWRRSRTSTDTISVTIGVAFVYPAAKVQIQFWDAMCQRKIVNIHCVFRLTTLARTKINNKWEKHLEYQTGIHELFYRLGVGQPMRWECECGTVGHGMLTCTLSSSSQWHCHS